MYRLSSKPIPKLAIPDYSLKEIVRFDDQDRRIKRTERSTGRAVRLEVEVRKSTKQKPSLVEITLGFRPRLSTSNRLSKLPRSERKILIRHYTHDVFRVPHGTYDEMVDSFKSQLIDEAMSFAQGNQCHASEYLDLPRSTLQSNSYIGNLGDSGVQVIEVRLSNYQDMVYQCRRAIIVPVLEQTNGNQSRSAKILGMKRPTLQYQMGELGLDSNQFKTKHFG